MHSYADFGPNSQGIINHGNLVAQFSRALSIIAKVLPRAEISADLYRTDEMKDAVASLYAHVLLFLQQAVKWYNVGPAGRALTALFKPFELSYQDTVEQIMLCTQAIDDIASISSKVEIREIKALLQGERSRLEERETKLHEMQLRFNETQAELSATVAQVLQIVTGMIWSCPSKLGLIRKRKMLTYKTGERSRLEEIHFDVKDMKPRLIDIHFNTILKVLQPRTCPEEALRKQRGLVRRSSPWRSQNQETLKIIASVGQWISSPQSSVLVLQSQPRAQNRVKEIATQVIGLLQPQSKKVIWHLSDISLDGVAAVDVLRSLVFQSLKLEPGLVVSEANSFTAASMHASHSETEWLDLLCHILKKLDSCLIIIEASDVLVDSEEAFKLVQVFQILAGRLQNDQMPLKLLFINYEKEWPDLGPTRGGKYKVLVVKREPPVPVSRRRLGTKSTISGAGWKAPAKRNQLS